MKQKGIGIIGKRKLASNKHIALIDIFIGILILLSASISVASACETYVLVNPGESIQAAIDSICPEGGIVELAPGIHTPTATIQIVNRQNITIRGTGINREDTQIRYEGYYPSFHTFWIEGINCTNITLENLNLTKNYYGVLFYQTNNSIIRNFYSIELLT